MNKNTKKETQQQDEVTKTVMGMLKLCEQDLTKYTENYKKKEFHYAVELMQQAVEKFGKSIIALLKNYNANDLRNKVKHQLVAFFVKEIKIQLNNLKTINPELEKILRELIINKLYPYFKKEFHTKDDLIISFEQLKNILEEYNYFEKMIGTYETFMFESLPMKIALNEFDRTKDALISQVVNEHNITLTDEQKLKVSEEFQKTIVSGEFFEEVRNTFYITLLLGYVVVMHSNLEKHQSSSRYDLEREKRYSKESELVQILPLMYKIMKKMIVIWYYLIRINNPDVENN